MSDYSHVHILLTVPPYFKAFFFLRGGAFLLATFLWTTQVSSDATPINIYLHLVQKNPQPYIVFTDDYANESYTVKGAESDRTCSPSFSRARTHSQFLSAAEVVNNSRLSVWRLKRFLLRMRGNKKRRTIKGVLFFACMLNTQAEFNCTVLAGIQAQ